MNREIPKANEYCKLFNNLTNQWHIDEDYDISIENSLLDTAKSIHKANFGLWHREDEARRVDVGDSYIAKMKREIDKLNQYRNDMIEKYNELLLERLPRFSDELPINSETPGSIVDRLSILILKIYHMKEQTIRKDVSYEHIKAAQCKKKILEEQLLDLSQAFDRLIEDYLMGKKRLKLYYQFKMYNDPNLNPALYKNKKEKNR